MKWKRNPNIMTGTQPVKSNFRAGRAAQVLAAPPDFSLHNRVPVV